MCEPVMTGAPVAHVPQPDDVADGVDGDGEVQVLHPGDDQVPAPPVLVGEGQPAAPAVARVADRGQLLQPAHQAGVIGSEAGMEAGAGHGGGNSHRSERGPACTFRQGDRHD